jgi:hypothetical protein
MSLSVIFGLYGLTEKTVQRKSLHFIGLDTRTVIILYFAPLPKEIINTAKIQLALWLWKKSKGIQGL